MISAKKIVDELKKNNNLFKYFLPKSNYNFNFRDIKSFKKLKTVIVIGMGGSILGTKAIYSFLKYKIKKKFVFIDNLDQEFLKKIKKENNLSRTLFLIVSKSGNTSETIINLSYFKKYLKKSNVIIISENKNNILSNFAKRNRFYFIKHNSHIGGRYSVFSEVGMLPAYLMGLKTVNFKKNLPKFLKNRKILSNSIRKISNLKIKKSKVLILFNYVSELNDFMLWCQQLLAESLGKNKKGFIPVISGAPKDHHSLLQLYLDGPRDKIFYVFSSKSTNNLKINSSFLGEKAKYINKKNYHDIKLSQKNAFIQTLKDNKIPFREIIIKKFDEDTIGQLFLLFIFETIAISKILKVNPFDQPAVEKVKILTKQFLN
tara:strand:- start:40 stop:1158 length:1119 start_codon:yes stop_codon:yes gene_type:complete